MKWVIPRGVQKALEERKRACAERSLVLRGDGIDLCSNDYLGISRALAAFAPVQDGTRARLGATGSRLVSGTTEVHESLEGELAAFHETPTALIFGSGYEANIGLLGSLGSRHDTIIYDELVHASMRDGIRLSNARSYSFRHNDVEDLVRKISASRGDCFVAVESIYSMDGDRAPLQALCEVCERAGAFLIVDEAHGTGVCGPKGTGVVQELGLAQRVYARIHTFGKALGYRGAVVVGPRDLRDYLINFARSFIYSTAPDLVTLEYIRHAYGLMQKAESERVALNVVIEETRAMREEFPRLSFLDSSSPIQGVVIPSNEAVLAAESALIDAGYFVRGIRSPTVPKGSERMRICLHSYNTSAQVRGALEVLSKVMQ